MAWVGRKRHIFFAFALFLLSLIFTASTPLVVYSQSGNSAVTIESDNGQVEQAGVWTSQSSPAASNGTYLYSSGSTDDVLTIEFSGTSIEIIYLEHAAFGTFAIDIDNTIVRTVVTTNEATTFDKRASIDYLDDGPHTLRVYPVEGTIAIDAFIATPAQIDRTEVATTWYVSTSGLDTNDCLTTSTDCLTIQAAINKASSGDTIQIATGTYFEAIIVDKDVSLDGGTWQNTIIDGTGQLTSVVEIVAGATVQIQDIGIMNGTSGKEMNYVVYYTPAQYRFGGGVFNAGNLTLTNVAVSDNILKFDNISGVGGGIYNHDSATLTLNDVYVDDNEVWSRSTTGPTLDDNMSFGAGIFNAKSASLVVNDGRLKSNANYYRDIGTTNSGVEGGGIFSQGDLTIIDCDIWDNVVNGAQQGYSHGAGIYIAHVPSRVVIDNTRLRLNTAVGPTNSVGGAVVLSDGVATGEVFISNSTISNNESEGDIGALLNFNVNLTIVNSLIADNQTKNYGAIVNNGNMNIANSTISGNQATGSYGGIYSSNALTLTHVTITNNIADSDNDSDGITAGLVTPNGYATFIKNSIIAGNTLGDGSASDCNFLDLDSVTSEYNILGDETCQPDITSILLEDDISTVILPLADNRGPTQTHALADGSIANDAIQPENCTFFSAGVNSVFNNGDPVTTDQRGEPRMATGFCDIGAYEDIPSIPPENLRATPSFTTNHQITLEWDYFGERHGMGFAVEISMNGVDNWTQIGTGSINAANFVQSYLFCDTTYYLRMRTRRNEDGAYVYSDYSEIISVTTLPCPEIVCNPNQLPIWVSAPPGGGEDTGWNYPNDISHDGRFTLFKSTADNFVPGTFPSSLYRVFRYDRQTCEIEIMSISPNGDILNADVARMSGDGRYVVFLSNIHEIGEINAIYVRDTQTNTTEQITPIDVDGHSFDPVISDDGRFVVFLSAGSNIVPNDTNSTGDIFLHDRTTGETIIVNRTPSGEQSGDFSIEPIISGDGQYVVFHSSASDLVDGDTNGKSDLFVYNRLTQEITLATVTSLGEQSNGASYHHDISADGQYLAFASEASNLDPNSQNLLLSAFLHNLTSSETFQIPLPTVPDGYGAITQTYNPSVSSDGRYVSFFASFTTGPRSIFVYDRVLEQTTPIDYLIQNTVGLFAVQELSGDGRFITISSTSRLVPGDTSSVNDVYLIGVWSVDAPTNLQATASSSTQIDLTWTDNSTDETAFHIERSPNGTDWSELTTVSANTTTYQDTVDCGTTYHYRIRAFRSTDSTYSGYSNIDQATSDPCSLPAPSNLTANAASSTQIDLSWIDNSADETAFHIERSSNGTDWTEIATVPADTTTYQNTVDCGTTYHYRLRAFRSSDSLFSPYSNTDQATTDACIPVNPSLIAPLDVTITGLNALPPTFEWNEAIDTTWYRFYLSIPSGLVLDKWYQKGNSEIVCNASTCSLTPNLVFPNANYTWYIHGWGPNGYTQWTSAGNFTVAVPAPNAINKTAPANTSILTSGGLTFTWDHDSNATWYQFHIAGVSTWYQATNICSGGTCTVTRNLTNAVYIWYVQGYGPGGYGPWGTGFNFTVAVPLPAIITKSAPIGPLSTAAPDFVWNHDPNAMWYHIWIGQGASPVYDQWQNAATICSAGTCTLNTGLTFIGNFEWYVRGWNSVGYGDWGSSTNFAYTLSLNSPTGTVNGVNLTYQWDHVSPTTTWYQIWVGTPSGTTYIQEWINAASACPTSTCSFTKTITLPAANYNWYIQPYGTYGYGPWSASQTFTVSP